MRLAFLSNYPRGGPSHTVGHTCTGHSLYPASHTYLSVMGHTLVLPLLSHSIPALAKTMSLTLITSATPLPPCAPSAAPQVLVTDIPGMKYGTIVWYLRQVRCLYCLY